MTSKSDAWMPLYIGDYLRDTGHLTTVEHGAYMLLIMQAWTREGLLPDDDERLRVLCRMTPKQWRLSRSAIMEMFQKVDGGYRHKRVDAELKKANKNREQRQAAGTASAQARANANATTPPNTNATTVVDWDATSEKPPAESERNESGQHIANKENVVNARSPPVGDPLERTAVPSPSPSESIAKLSCEYTKPRVTVGGLEGVVVNAEGRAVCGDWYFEDVAERVYDAARIDVVRWRGNLKPLIDWLNAGIEPDVIVRAITKKASWQGYKVPFSLAWFRDAIEAELGTKPVGKAH